MAIISTLTRRVRNVIGDRSVTHGKFGDASGGGEIDTGLEICEHLQLQGTASASVGTSVVYSVNSAEFPRSGTGVPVISNTASGGIWWAYGR